MRTKHAHMKSIVHIIASLRMKEGFTLQNKEKFEQTKDLGKVLKVCINGKRINEIRTNQGLGV